MKRGVAEKVMPLFVDIVALELRLFEIRIMFFRDFIIKYNYIAIFNNHLKQKDMLKKISIKDVY